MEDTGYNFDQVHVLRQTFQPNEPFQAALTSLITAGPNGPRPFSIYGSDERILEMNEAGSRELNIQKRDADRFVETRHNVHLELDGGINARVLKTSARGAVALQLVMKPQNILEYARIRDGLDIVKLGRRGHAIGFEATRLYANIPFDQLLPIPQVKERLAEMNKLLADTASRRLYQVTPNPYIVGQFVPRAGHEVATVSYPEIRAS